MLSIRQSCHAALRGSNTVCAYVIGSRRAFSRSSALSRGALPLFLESSSPELTTLLSNTNSKILLPFHLTPEQRKLIYRKENKAKLEAEPVEITLGDVTLALEHIDRLQTPRRWPTIRDVLSKSETREDWENVVRMVEGYHNAGIPLTPDHQALIVRMLNMKEMHHIILKALQRVEETGISMREWEVLRQVLRAVYDKAALSDWDQEETYKAVRMAKQVAELLEDEHHCGGQPAEHDFRGRPAVVAVPTALAAVRALKHNKDVEEVKTMARRLMAAMEQHDYMTTLDTFDIEDQAMLKKNAYRRYGGILRSDALPYLHIKTALETSMKVLKDDMPEAQKAQEYATKTSQVLAALLEAAQKHEAAMPAVDKSAKNGMVVYMENILAKSKV